MELSPVQYDRVTERNDARRVKPLAMPARRPTSECLCAGLAGFIVIRAEDRVPLGYGPFGNEPLNLKGVLCNHIEHFFATTGRKDQQR